MIQTSTQKLSLAESCRWCECSREGPAEWTVEGGLNGVHPQYAATGFSPVTKERRVFARYRVGALASIWVVPQKCNAFVPGEV